MHSRLQTLLLPLLLRLSAPLCALSVATVAVAAPAPAAPSAPPLPADPGPTLSRIQRSGVINVGYIPTPGTFAFVNERGETVGYSIDLCWRVIAAVRSALKNPNLRVAFRPVKPAERIPFLESGTIDIECGGNTNTVRRQEKVDFSYTFFVTGARALVRKSPNVNGLGDLKDKKVAVAKGTTAEDLARSEQRLHLFEMLLVSGDDEGLQAVESGRAQAYVQDDILLYGLMAKSTQRTQLAVVGKYLSAEPYAFMLPKGDTVFVGLVDRALLDAFYSGDALRFYRKWFDTDAMRIPMHPYLSESLRFPNKHGIP